MTDARKDAPSLERRELLAGAAASVAASAIPAAAFAQPARQPNILFILADDLGYADLSSYGRRDYRTPVLDKLAADGLLMTQGYSNSSVCSPTRVALITGRYQQRLPIGIAEPLRPSQRSLGLPGGQPTLPSLLKRVGYRTILVGKWHLGWPPEHGPLQSGYDRFFGIAPAAADYISHRVHDLELPPTNGLYEGNTAVVRPGYLTDLLADRAVEEIRASREAGAPFLLSLHFNAPHWPWQVPGDPAIPEKISRPDVIISNLHHDDGGGLEKFAEMVRLMDAAIGRVLAELESAGFANDTIVVLTSDNGGERFSDTWPLRGGKGELLEGGIRVPLIVRWPGTVVPGGRSDQVMVSMDWLPTLLAAAGGSPDPAYPPDGMNLVNVIGGAPEVPRKLFWRFRARQQAAVRDGDWKYLRIDGEEFLFDIARDPRERANLKQSSKTEFERLKADFVEWEKTMLSYPPDRPGTKSRS